MEILIFNIFQKASGLDIRSEDRKDAEVAATTDAAEDSAESSSTTAEHPTNSDAPSEPREVYLTKKCGAELDMIVSSTDTESFVVSFILPRGASERMDAVDIGDEILSVNGVKLKGVEIEFAQTLVKSIEGSVRMEVRQNKKLEPKIKYYLWVTPFRNDLHVFLHYFLFKVLDLSKI